MHQENKDKDDTGPKDIIKTEFDKARRKDEIYRETLKYLESNEKLQKYLADFSPDSAEHAISSYAWQKAGWIVNKETNQWMLETRMLKYKNEAEECLQNIQQKKLFDTQCLWRARQFEHPSLQTTHDFTYWERNVLNCPFLDPITQEDVDLYIEFIQQHLGEDLPFLTGWQDYNSFNSSFATIGKMVNRPPVEEEEDEEEEEDDNKDEDGINAFDDETEDGEGGFGEDMDEDENLMPAWYLFWYTRRGDSHYLVLPDLRQEKEWFYTQLALEELNEQTRKEYAENPPDVRPALWLHSDEELKSFIGEFEKDSKEVLSAFDAHQKLSLNTEDDGEMERAEEAWYDLDDCYEEFPIAEGVTDWKEALILTAIRWRNTNITRMLPVVFDEYLFRLQTGIEQPYNKKDAEKQQHFADTFKGHILRGRELNGEPRDFNF